jgi:hypothetical protein
VISSASRHEAVADNRLARLVSCWVERNDGVPPPKYTKLIGRPLMAGCLT